MSGSEVAIVGLSRAELFYVRAELAADLPGIHEEVLAAKPVLIPGEKHLSILGILALHDGHERVLKAALAGHSYERNIVVGQAHIPETHPSVLGVIESIQAAVANHAN